MRTMSLRSSANPANKQISVAGFGDGTNAEKRVEATESMLEGFPDYNSGVTIRGSKSRPRKAHKLPSASHVEFMSADLATAFF